MRARIIRIGNSRGLRIPKPILDQAGLEEEVELTVDGGRLVIQPSRLPRTGWAAAAVEAAATSAEPAPALLPTRFDTEEWSW